MKKIFQFGKQVKGYDVLVLNEREVRAGAGILLIVAISTFFYAFLLGDFYPTKIFVTLFLVDFIVRVLINPHYAPSLILGRLVVSNQEVEYVGAPQKRFARGIGLFLSLWMFILLVILNLVNPINLLICVVCVIFLFFESTLGICLGCLIYNTFTKNSAQLCPGGTCKETTKKPIQYVYGSHIVVLILFVLFALSLPYRINTAHVTARGGDDSCIVPDRAKAIGHEELWLEHHGCEETIQESGPLTRQDKDIQDDIVLPEESIQTSEQENTGVDYDPNDPCQNIPEGHPRDLWLMHNGCIQ